MSIQDVAETVPSAPPLDPVDYIRLDRSRMVAVRLSDGTPSVSPDGKVYRTEGFSTISGDRTPEDPWYNVAHLQDGLPFDANGNLIPPNPAHTGPFKGRDADDKEVTYRPLYTPAMHKVLEKKMRQVTMGIDATAPSEDDLESEIEARSVASEGVNLIDWATGKANYPMFLVTEACKRRFGFAAQSEAEAIRFMVMDAKAISKDQLGTRFKRHFATLK